LWFIHRTIYTVAGQLFFHVAEPVKHLTAFLAQCGYKVLSLL